MAESAVQLSSDEAASLLAWWLEAGVDVPVQDVPRNWLKKDPPAPLLQDQEAAFGAAPSPGRTTAPNSSAAPAAAVSEVEQMPESLPLFREWLAQSTALPLAQTGARRILPAGTQDAPLMLLADTPSGDEALSERPIAGQAWELTERILQAIGIDPAETYLANISCFHAPGSRLSASELESCGTIARRHVALARPKRLLLLGDAPSRALLGKPVASARGHVHSVEGVHTVATFHPRFLLNRPSDKALAWKDLLLLMEDLR